jgi:hypothetical protein
MWSCKCALKTRKKPPKRIKGAEQRKASENPCNRIPQTKEHDQRNWNSRDTIFQSITVRSLWKSSNYDHIIHTYFTPKRLEQIVIKHQYTATPPSASHWSPKHRTNTNFHTRTNFWSYTCRHAGTVREINVIHTNSFGDERFTWTGYGNNAI